MKKNGRKITDLATRIMTLENKIDELSSTLKSIDESLKTLSSISLNDRSKQMEHMLTEHHKCILENIKILAANQTTIFSKL